MTDQRNENASRRLTDKEIEENLLGLEKTDKNLSSLKDDEIKEKFKKVFGHSPYLFPESASLEDKVKYVSEGTKQVRAIKNENLIQKMKNISKLSQELDSKKKLFKEEGRKNLERIDKQVEKYGYHFTNEGIKSSKELTTKASLREDTHNKHIASPINSKENAAQTHLKNNLEPTLNYLKKTASAFNDKKEYLKDNLNTLNKGSYTPDKKTKEDNIIKESGFINSLKNLCKKVLKNLFKGTESMTEKNLSLKGMQDLDKEQVGKTTIGLEESTKHRDKVLKERDIEQNKQPQIRM